MKRSPRNAHRRRISLTGENTYNLIRRIDAQSGAVAGIGKPRAPAMTACKPRRSTDPRRRAVPKSSGSTLPPITQPVDLAVTIDRQDILLAHR